MSIESNNDPYGYVDSELFDHSRNILNALEIASSKNVDLVVFPEGYLRNFGERQLYVNDLSLNPAIRDITQACRKLGVWTQTN